MIDKGGKIKADGEYDNCRCGLALKQGLTVEVTVAPRESGNSPA